MQPNQMPLNMTIFQTNAGNSTLFEIFNLPAVAEHEGIAVFQQVDDRMIVVDRDDPFELRKLGITDLDGIIKAGEEVFRRT